MDINSLPERAKKVEKETKTFFQIYQEEPSPGTGRHDTCHP